MPTELPFCMPPLVVGYALYVLVGHIICMVQQSDTSLASSLAHNASPDVWEAVVL